MSTKTEKEETATKDEVASIISEAYENAVFTVEEHKVWVSGMNSSPRSLANRIASELVGHDIPCSNIIRDDANAFNGFEFRYGEEA